MMRAVYIIFFLLTGSILSAQNKLTLNGYIKDSLSGETLIGATITVQNEDKVVTTNQYGFFSITLNRGGHDFLITYVGYQPKLLHYDLVENLQTNILISSLSAAIADVTVTAKKRESNVNTAQMGKAELDINTVKALPVLFGEVDILKTLQLMPGVRNAGEGNAGFYVRGGGPDQNLIMLDDAVVYNTGHLFGFFSVFNSDAIKSLSLIKGGMPAQYGGRLSSVVDIAMKDGNLNKTQVDAGIGLIASRLAIQGPIKKEKASYIISARRTYIDQLVKPFIKKGSQYYGSGYYFYDLNAKVNYIISSKDRLYLSGYAGRDVFDFVNAKRSLSLNIPWGNLTATLRWNHIFNKKLFANTTLVYNDYKFTFSGKQNDFNIGLRSSIRDANAKIDLDYYPLPEYKIKFGAQFTRHTFLPNIASGSQDSTVFAPNNSTKKYANELAAYIQNEWQINKRLQINAGLRYSRFMQMGPYTSFTTDAFGNKTDSTIYGSGKVVKSYDGLEPRATMRVSLNTNSSLKFGVTRNLQYIHLVSNSGTTLPTDVWVPSTLKVKPQIAWQYAAGYFRNFNNNMFETSLEVYYKQMQNQIEYREGYTPTFLDPEIDFVFGKGWSYGSELFVNKVKGRLTGWVGYTLSWTWRKFPQLNDGEKFYGKYDRRHDLSVVGNYLLNNKWKFSSVFVYATGNAITLPERFYFIDNVLSYEYSRINSYRMRAYHRLDVAATYTPQPKKKHRFSTNWVFSIYNIYSRANPYFYYFDQEGSPLLGNLKVVTKQVSIFPIIPSVTFNVKW